MTGIWHALDANQQLVLIFILTMAGGIALGGWSWWRAVRVVDVKPLPPREIVYDWSVEAWADFDATERAS